ncbi:MAG: lipopolysaccharide biosynthesis protein [Pseudomonadota bacterium]
MTPQPPLDSSPAAKPRSVFQQIISNAGILLGGKATNAVLGLATVALAARALGIETFGVLVLVHAYVQTVGDIAKFQSWQALLNYGTAAFDEKRFGHFHRVLRFSLLLDGISGLAGLAIALAGVLLIGGGLGWPAAEQTAVALYTLSILFNIGATPMGALRLVNRFDLLAAESTLESLIRLIGAALAWWLGAGLHMFLLIWFVAKVISCLFLFGSAAWVLHRQRALSGFRWRMTGSWTQDMPGVWPFVWSTNFNSTLGLAFTQVGTLMVGAMLGATEAALYRIAKQLADAVAKPAKLIVPALYPELARLASKPDRTALRKLVRQLALAGGGVATTLLVLVALFGGAILTVLIGPEFGDAKPVMMWLLTGAVISIWAVPLEPLLMSGGHASEAFWMRLVVTVLYVPLLYWMIHTQALHGAGVAAVIGATMLLLGQLWLVQRWFGQQARAL